MRILQLCHKPPSPPKDGGCIAMNNISEGLIEAGHDLKILTIHTHKHDFELEKLSDHYLETTKIESVFVDTRINLVDAFSNLITSDSYNISRFFSADYDMKLQKVLKEEEFDVVLLESLFMTPYIDSIRRFSKANVVLRSHNLEYIIWERVAKGARNPAKKSYINLLARQLKNYELRIFEQVDAIVAISADDRKKYIQLGYEGLIETIPFGLDTTRFEPSFDTQPNLSLFHLGSMDWTPNLEGVLWFLDEVWPEILKTTKGITLHLAGRAMPAEIRDRKDPNVEIAGAVDDAFEFMKAHGIMVVPLLSAGGIRVKIIEGMALGKAIISTSIGAEGIDYTNGSDILIANTPKEFAAKVAELYQSPEKITEIGKSARILASTKFDNSLLTKNLLSFFEKIESSK